MARMSASEVFETFDRVVVLNLARRPERLERFYARLGDWPFRQPQRFQAINGKSVTAPPDWNHGAGAWGFLLSHRQVMFAPPTASDHHVSPPCVHGGLNGVSGLTPIFRRSLGAIGAAIEAATAIVYSAAGRLMPAAKRVLAITVDQDEAPYRLRIEILRDLLREDGFEFEFVARPREWSQRRRLIAGAGAYHAVIVQRKLLDPSHARLLRRRARRIIYDIDDAVMTQRRQIGRISQWLKRRRYLATARIMDHVVAGNENLAGAFRELGCAVTMLPTVVDPAHYRCKTHAPTDRPTLVWIGSRSTLPYLQQWMPALETAAKRVPGLRLLTIANDSVKSDVIEVQHIPWSLETEADALVRGDIGIAPTPLDPWTLGKCGFKIIQYMAAGLPVIASPVGMNCDIVTENETGLLPPTPEQWPDAIERLVNDVELRAKMGTAGRERVCRDFSLARTREVWAQILQ